MPVNKAVIMFLHCSILFVLFLSPPDADSSVLKGQGKVAARMTAWETAKPKHFLSLDTFREPHNCLSSFIYEMLCWGHCHMLEAWLKNCLKTELSVLVPQICLICGLHVFLLVWSFLAYSCDFHERDFNFEQTHVKAINKGPKKIFSNILCHILTNWTNK